MDMSKLRFGNLFKNRSASLVIVLLILVAVFSAINPIYLSLYNLIDIIEQATINGLLAIGITFAIITGGIDLSIGSTMAVVIVTTGKLLVSGVNMWLCLVAGIAMGAAFGMINGFMVTKMRLQPFIATLGSMSVFRVVAYITTGGWPVLRIPREFRNLVDGDVLGNIPASVFLLFGFAAICHVILRHTRQGTYFLAAGGNEEATRLSGVNTNRTRVIAYGITGVGAALAGLVMLARLGTGEPTAGQGYETNAIAAAAIGGTSMAGGRGSMIGTVLGALTLSALKVGLVVLGVDTFWQYIAMGSIIVLAAYFEVIQTSIESRMIRRAASSVVSK
jgi:ribose transport system permease protein